MICIFQINKIKKTKQNKSYIHMNITHLLYVASKLMSI